MIKSISEDNYKTFLLKTLEERKLFSYPPYNELITIEYRDGTTATIADQTAYQAAKESCKD